MVGTTVGERMKILVSKATGQDQNLKCTKTNFLVLFDAGVFDPDSIVMSRNKRNITL